MDNKFKFAFDEKREYDPAKKDAEAKNFYETESNIRSVSFVNLDGSKVFVTYASLTSGEFNVEQNKLVVSFTSYKITLSGLKMELLFEDLRHQLPKQIFCVDARYNTIQEDRWVVNSMELKSLGKKDKPE